MKKGVTFLILTIALNGYGQGNLQFNKVITIEADTTLSCPQYSNCVDTFLIREFVVASNKVLKIESINTTLAAYSPSSYSLYLNSFKFTNPAGNLNLPTGVIFPIWLSAGTYKLYYYGQGNPIQSPVFYTYSYLFSAIEFNIIQ